MHRALTRLAHDHHACIYQDRTIWPYLHHFLQLVPRSSQGTNRYSAGSPDLVSARTPNEETGGYLNWPKTLGTSIVQRSHLCVSASCRSNLSRTEGVYLDLLKTVLA